MPLLASLLNLSGPDLIVIGGVILLLFGAKKLPEFGGARREFEYHVTGQPILGPSGIKPAKPPFTVCNFRLRVLLPNTVL
jgi:hypothetical protein